MTTMHNIRSVLADVGLSEGEITTYLSLLQTGPATVHQINKKAGMHRTSIYAFLEKLLERNLVSYTLQGGVKVFHVNNPQRFLDVLDEKQDKLRSVLPEITMLAGIHAQELNVEVLQGTQGFIAMWNDILREKTDYCVLGSANKIYADQLSDVIHRHFRKELTLGIKTRVLVHKGTGSVFNYENKEYRFLPEDFPLPTSTVMYGGKVAIHIWNPTSTIVIDNKDFATGYKAYFELLWLQGVVA